MLAFKTPRPLNHQGQPLIARKAGLLASVLLVIAALMASTTSVASAQGMSTLRDLEARLLEQRLDEHSEADRRARTAEGEYRTLRGRLSGVLGDSTVSLKELRTLEADTSLARERAYLRDREATALRREIYSHLERIQEMDQILAGLGQGITGTWGVNFGENSGSGSVAFRMNGERVIGTYRFTDGTTGIMRGELVGRTILLTRYGARGEKHMQINGQLSADGRTMTGEWIAEEFANGKPSVGAWTARKGAQ